MLLTVHINRVSWQGANLDAITHLCNMQQLHSLSIEFVSFGEYFSTAAHRAHAALGVLTGLEAQPAWSSNSSSASCASVAGGAGEATDAQSHWRGGQGTVAIVVYRGRVCVWICL